jgi:hypothetical protein
MTIFFLEIVGIQKLLNYESTIYNFLLLILIEKTSREKNVTFEKTFQ